MTGKQQHDLAIIGGGLAGLTLALQLKREQPELDIVVLERGRWPVPARQAGSWARYPVPASTR